MKARGRATRIIRSLDPRFAAIGITFLLFGIAAFATCGGCGRRGTDAIAPPSASASASQAAAVATSPLIVDAAALRDPLLWDHAKNGETEDLASLAAHEGAMGLIEAANGDPSLRSTAIRAMGHARGWAQLPFLAKAASATNEEEARIALEAVIDLAARPRRAEDPEDAGELREGCEGLTTLARDAKGQKRPRRVAAIRALRMMPCPSSKEGDLPTDVDSK